MKYFAKKELSYKFFVLIGLWSLLFSTFTGAHAQKSIAQADSDVKQASPQVLLVPNGFAAVSSTTFDGLTATIRVVDITQFGSLWTNSANYAPFDSSGSMPTFLSWSSASFQNQTMRGLTLGRSGTVIYASVSPYAGSDRTPRIYQIGPTTTTPSVLTTLPFSTKYGVGSIDFAGQHNLIYATNIDDGKIYAIRATNGTIHSTFDPGVADTSGTNLPPLGERVIAVAYHPLERRVYYSVWGAANNNTIRSVAVDATGAFAGGDKLEVTVAGSQTPVGDIEFSLSGKRMLVAEEPVSDGGSAIYLNAHIGRGLEYVGGSSSTWTLDPVNYVSGRKYGIGNLGGGTTNARGGAAWGYASLRTSPITGTTFNCDETFVLFTGDALRFTPGFVYGLQFTPSTGGSAGGGGSVSNSLIADLDYNVAGQDKMVYHDVDVRKDRGLFKYVSGAVLDRLGNPLVNIAVTISFQAGNSMTAQTNASGIYRFDDITPGETVVVSVSAKQYTFNEPVRVITVDDDIADLNFYANE